MNQQANTVQPSSPTYFNVDGVEAAQPDWFVERMKEMERLAPTGGPMSLNKRADLLEWLHIEGVVPLVGGGVIRNCVLGADPETREGVGISFIEGGVATPIVVWGKSIQGVHFEEAAIFALNRYAQALREGTKMPSPSSQALRDLYPSKGSMPRKVIEQLYATRDAELAVLAAQASIGAADLIGLDWSARAKVASEQFSRCDAVARNSLLRDGHHHVRSCASLAQADLVKQEGAV
ncbi:hypothetical protein [Paraburkholderia sp. SIMBA_054]|uniref:hypothetical protein n=1 Tax=Paraburkholderia sp. SIMBA_054 TaxID=3085795 RepID=UPI00397A6A2D